jgi:ATP-dependent Lon protease
VPGDVRERMTFHPVETIDEVLSLALQQDAVPLAA